MLYNVTMPKETRPCDHCGTPVTRWPSLFYGSVSCSPPCRSALASDRQRGEANPCWRGGRYVEPGKCYVMIRRPDHPRARQNGYVPEHVLVVESVLGRHLLPGEEVHHRNRVRDDNRPENLQVYASHGEHWEVEHLPLIRPKVPPCACGRPHLARGLCQRHYARWRRARRTGRTPDLS
jgi:hypothetical protein